MSRSSPYINARANITFKRPESVRSHFVAPRSRSAPTNTSRAAHMSKDHSHAMHGTYFDRTTMARLPSTSIRKNSGARTDAPLGLQNFARSNLMIPQVQSNHIRTAQPVLQPNSQRASAFLDRDIYLIHRPSISHNVRSLSGSRDRSTNSSSSRPEAHDTPKALRFATEEAVSPIELVDGSSSYPKSSLLVQAVIEALLVDAHQRSSTQSSDRLNKHKAVLRWLFSLATFNGSEALHRDILVAVEVSLK